MSRRTVVVMKLELHRRLAAAATGTAALVGATVVLSAAPSHAAVPPYYTFQNRATRTCLTGGIGIVSLTTCKDTNLSQQWLWTSKQQLKNRQSGLCLGVDTDSGLKIAWTESCDPNGTIAGQLWSYWSSGSDLQNGTGHWLYSSGTSAYVGGPATQPVGSQYQWDRI